MGRSTGSVGRMAVPDNLGISEHVLLISVLRNLLTIIGL